MTVKTNINFLYHDYLCYYVLYLIDITPNKGVKNDMKRRIAREKALQALFQIDISDTDVQEAIENVLDGNQADEFLNSLVIGVVDQLETIDTLISQNLENWSIDRLSKVDRAILRIALYEMKFLDEIPVNVSINEAIELAKSFGDEESSKFINGVLSKIKKN